jgi:hypothetical protein
MRLLDSWRASLRKRSGMITERGEEIGGKGMDARSSGDDGTGVASGAGSPCVRASGSSWREASRGFRPGRS